MKRVEECTFVGGRENNNPKGMWGSHESPNLTSWDTWLRQLRFQLWQEAEDMP